MSISIINKNIHKMYEWLYDISDNLQTENLDVCLTVLRVALHQLRDHIPLINAVHLSQQLPFMIRGIFFEAWNPEEAPIKPKDLEVILEQAKLEFRAHAHPDLEAKNALKAAYKTLCKKIPNGIWKNILNVAPKGLKEIFYEVKAAY